MQPTVLVSCMILCKLEFLNYQRNASQSMFNAGKSILYTSIYDEIECLDMDKE